MENNKKDKLQSVLINKKLSQKRISEIYIGIHRGNINSRAKSFTEDNYAFLNKKCKNDTIAKFWSKRNSEQFFFEKLISADKVSEYDAIIGGSDPRSEIIRYSLSAPVFINDKKNAMFLLFKMKGMRYVIEDCVIIMKKEKGKWVFLEKVYSTALH